MDEIEKIHELHFITEDQLEACIEIDMYGEKFWKDYYWFLTVHFFNLNHIHFYFFHMITSWKHYEQDFLKGE